MFNPIIAYGILLYTIYVISNFIPRGLLTNNKWVGPIVESLLLLLHPLNVFVLSNHVIIIILYSPSLVLFGALLRMREWHNASIYFILDQDQLTPQWYVIFVPCNEVPGVQQALPSQQDCKY